MSSSPRVLCPPFHVQTAAQGLKNGYPYFDHHDAVSLLWTHKWRPNAAAGIYPFFDGNVEDFDPVFAELVRISGDDPAILSRPDEYGAPFVPVAEDLTARAEGHLSAGRREQARDLFLRAAAVHRISRFPIIRSAHGDKAWSLGKAAYEKGGRLLDPPSVPVSIPFTHADPAAGDATTDISAYLRVPQEPPPRGGRPVLLFICGLDAYKTDNTPRTQAHVERGFVTVSFEIPGTGDCPAAADDPRSTDRLLSSVLDWVDANAGTYAMHTGKICARGISTGGYNAFRLAHTHAERVFAVVGQGGGAHYMYHPDWIEHQDRMEYPFALVEALAWKHGFRDEDTAQAVADYQARGSKFSLLDSGILDRPSSLLLCLNGMEDSIFPVEDSILVALSGGRKEIHARSGLRHMGNPGGEEIVYDWLDRQVANHA
jgi:hypothetical protein